MAGRHVVHVSDPEEVEMPLKRGGKKAETIKKNVGENIKTLRKDGYPQSQAVAIAMDIAQKAKSKAKKG